MTTKAEAALTYASWGWHVIPVVPNGKVPATQHGVKDATIDPEQITQWWAQNPDFNIGVAAGERSGIVVFDVDPRNGGDESWSKWLDENGQVPEGAAMQMTAGGGEHHIAMYDPEIRSCKLTEGVDLLADGRYAPFAKLVDLTREAIETGAMIPAPAQLHFRLGMAMRDVDKVLAAALRSTKEEGPMFSRSDEDGTPSYAKRVTGTIDTKAFGGSVAYTIGKFGPVKDAAIDTHYYGNEVRLRVYDAELLRKGVQPSRAVVETFIFSHDDNAESSVHTLGFGQNAF